MTDSPLVTAAWAALAAHRAAHADARPGLLLARDPGRFARFSLALDDLLLDYSKTAIDDEARALLLRLAEATGVARRRDAMFAGERVNATEGRAALHVALRHRGDAPVRVDGADVMPEVRAGLARLSAFAGEVRGGRFADVVNIGIGGSDLGPAMATLALAPFHDGPRLHFVSNVDGAHLADTLARLDPARTLFVLASKTFTTVETMANAASARRWIADALGEAAVPAHFAAVSTALERAAAFGIDASRVFGFWDWVGGRYSVWSAVGLPLMIAIGPARFAEFLDGAHEMDVHFRVAPLDANMPVLLGLVGIWHRNACGYPTRAVLPYDQRLARLPAYLQQLDMESNGKRVDAAGAPVARATGPVVWGEPGTNGQHAFFQLLHQGTDIVPCEFLVAANGHEPGMAAHHELLLANCLAQSEALMNGRDDPGLPPHRRFPGGRPSITIAYRSLDPRTLGRLLALYEHRVFVEAAIHGINPFDQWGVELGKEMATRLLPMVRGDAKATGLDASTAGLLAHLRTLRRG
ncbi:MAG: glucose-6-phosphate isomerase [Alphaproteobacteria bacterium]|nr:glucose-6-phosphate isomerase [Alphaproteobacteria bacterium]